MVFSSNDCLREKPEVSEVSNMRVIRVPIYHLDKSRRIVKGLVVALAGFEPGNYSIRTTPQTTIPPMPSRSKLNSKLITRYFSFNCRLIITLDGAKSSSILDEFQSVKQIVIALKLLPLPVFHSLNCVFRCLSLATSSFTIIFHSFLFCLVKALIHQIMSISVIQISTKVTVTIKPSPAS